MELKNHKEERKADKLADKIASKLFLQATKEFRETWGPEIPDIF